jgi:hypothetical protein
MYAELAAGGASPIPELTPTAVDKYNATQVADIGEADSRMLSKALTVTVGQFLDATSGRPAETSITWHGGIRIDLAPLTGILVAEYVLHGYDIAAATGVAWPILPEQAALGLFGRGAVFPQVADPTTSRGHTATYLLDLGAAGRLTVRFVEGVLTVGTGEEPADCEIATDAVTMLMVSSGRLSPYMAIALGIYRPGGHSPHLAPGFTRLIYTF